MRMTIHRQEVIEILKMRNLDCGVPPYSASNIGYLYEQQLDKPKTPQQIHRTLNDLLGAGLVVVSRRKEKRPNQLPMIVRVYELSEGAEKQVIEDRIDAVLNYVTRAVDGVPWFGKNVILDDSPSDLERYQKQIDELLLLRPDDSRLYTARDKLKLKGHKD